MIIIFWWLIIFIGRKSELDTLNKQYRKRPYSCIVLYGCRRVGKTALINEFRKDKPSIMFSAVKGTESDNLRELSRVISEYQYGMEENIAISFSDFRSALVSISRLAKNKHLVFCIDELPYLAAAIPSDISVLQHFLDYEAKESGLFVITQRFINELHGRKVFCLKKNNIWKKNWPDKACPI